MRDRIPPRQAAAGRNSNLGLVLLAIALVLALGLRPAWGGNPANQYPPAPISGIAGVSFLTTGFAPLRQFYGRGAGFAEVPAGPGRIRFAIGTKQWIEFQTADGSGSPRRLLHVTLESASLKDLGLALLGRGVQTSWIGSDPRSRVLQLQDPAGNLIQVAEPWTAPAALPGAAVPFSDHLQHFGMAVARSQSDATIAFYRDTLGFPEVLRMADPDGRLAMAKFRLPGPRSELVELIFFDPPLNKWAAGAFDHVNFEVGDIGTAYRMLRNGGIATQAKHLPTVNGEHLWAINLTDPELTRVEIQVLAPTKAAVGTVAIDLRDP